MAGDDAVNEGQPNSGPLEFLLGVQSLKNAKELAGIAHVEAYPVVRHKENGFAILLAGADLDPRRLPRPGIFKRILQKTGPGLIEEGSISLDGWKRPNDPFNDAARAIRRVRTTLPVRIPVLVFVLVLRPPHLI